MSNGDIVDKQEVFTIRNALDGDVLGAGWQVSLIGLIHVSGNGDRIAPAEGINLIVGG